MIKLELEINAVNFILQTLGELPTKTGAWELLKIIKEQADPQVPKDEPKAE
jgi:hypothetical protein